MKIDHGVLFCLQICNAFFGIIEINDYLVTCRKILKFPFHWLVVDDNHNYFVDWYCLQ